MGIWGAAQAVAFGIGGFSGTVAVDVMRKFFDMPATAYAAVFIFEALLFVLAARLALRSIDIASAKPNQNMSVTAGSIPAEA